MYNRDAFIEWNKMMIEFSNHQETPEEPLANLYRMKPLLLICMRRLMNYQAGSAKECTEIAELITRQAELYLEACRMQMQKNSEDEIRGEKVEPDDNFKRVVYQKPINVKPAETADEFIERFIKEE